MDQITVSRTSSPLTREQARCQVRATNARARRAKTVRFRGRRIWRRFHVADIRHQSRILRRFADMMSRVNANVAADHRGGPACFMRLG
jgi:hypothetical protein